MNNSFPELSRGIRTLSQRFSTSKELHFFNNVRRNNYRLEAYARCFPRCSSDNSQLRGMDSTPNYLGAISVPELMQSMYPPDVRPQVRFIALLRHPSSRFRSWFDHFGPSRTNLGINQFVRLALRKTIACARSRGIDVTSSRALFNSKCRSLGPPVGQSLTGGLYAAQLMSFLHRFDPSQFAVISSGGYARQPLDVIQGLSTFLGLQLRPTPVEARRQNGGRRKHMPHPRALQLLDTFYEPSIPELGVLLDEHSKRGMAVLPPGVLHAGAAANTPSEMGRAFLSE
jgi:hypothetical protein